MCKLFAKRRALLFKSLVVCVLLTITICAVQIYANERYPHVPSLDPDAAIYMEAHIDAEFKIKFDKVTSHIDLSKRESIIGDFNIEYMEEEEKARIYMPDCTKVYTVISEVELEMYDREKWDYKEGWEKTHTYTMFYPEYMTSISAIRGISHNDKENKILKKFYPTGEIRVACSSTMYCTTTFKWTTDWEYEGKSYERMNAKGIYFPYTSIRKIDVEYGGGKKYRQFPYKNGLLIKSDSRGVSFKLDGYRFYDYYVSPSDMKNIIGKGKTIWVTVDEKHFDAAIVNGKKPRIFYKNVTSIINYYLLLTK